MRTPRIYLVSPDDSAESMPRLVRAISKAAAIKHVTPPYSAVLASQEQLVRALRSTDIEDAQQ